MRARGERPPRVSGVSLPARTLRFRISTSILPGIDRVALVVRNLQDGVDRYRSVFGIEQWAIHRFEPPALTDTTYRGGGTAYGMWLALADAGDTRIGRERRRGRIRLPRHRRGTRRTALRDIDPTRGRGPGAGCRLPGGAVPEVTGVLRPAGLSSHPSRSTPGLASGPPRPARGRRGPVSGDGRGRHAGI